MMHVFYKKEVEINKKNIKIY